MSARSNATTIRTRHNRAESGQPPLGSLTQRRHRTDRMCAQCGSIHLTQLSMNLTDGTPVAFMFCHRCEHRTWEHAGTELPVEGVLERTRKD